MNESSLDPRVQRVELPGPENHHEEGDLMQWQTYEVFTQQNRGEQHVHVGVVHGPNPDMALLFAKEQFGRREQCANIWVVKSQDIHATAYEDADMFEHAFNKEYREGSGYRVRETIELFQKQLDELLGEKDGTEGDATASQSGSVKVVHLPPAKGPRKVIIRGPQS
ncbi:hypothetical protein [Pontibacter sp. G13]|uniref:hypothetical protein n=1 Tax=Pontibacter sp. G13 TaxID=3074898 RepID=UPI00288A6E14|nr:hypothetical protein [Pontibacter sp. G13]WNJ20393.1 hypothetical protein RJD25_07920 [Pontibacter sp. G13]